MKLKYLFRILTIILGLGYEIIPYVFRFTFLFFTTIILCQLNYFKIFDALHF